MPGPKEPQTDKFVWEEGDVEILEDGEVEDADVEQEKA